MQATEAKLRGHHLICLNFFRGEGYSEEFIENIYSVIGNEKIEVVGGADDICAKCPYLKNNACSNYGEENMLFQDKQAMKLLGLKPGMIVTFKTISAKLPEILEQWKAQFCLDCVYRRVCFS